MNDLKKKKKKIAIPKVPDNVRGGLHPVLKTKKKPRYKFLMYDGRKSIVVIYYHQASSNDKAYSISMKDITVNYLQRHR